MATDLRRSPAVLDSGSFDSFYRRHLSEIYRFVLHDVGNRADAEEVTQTAFLDAFRALRRGHEPEMPRAWMYGIARNAARRRYRTLGRRPREVELGPALVDELADHEESPWVDAIRSAFAGLRSSHRQVLFLREVEGLSYAEISERMELSRSAVETLLFRARRALRELFEAEGVRPAVRPSRLESLKGLALLPAAFLGRLGDRLQNLAAPDLAAKTAGAVTAVALGAGVAVGTGAIPVGAATTSPDVARATSLSPVAAREAVAAWGEPEVAPARRTSEPKPRARSGKADRRERRDDPSDRPGGAIADGSSPGGGSGGGGSSDGGSGGGGGVVTTPPVGVPAVELPPVDVPAVDVPDLPAPTPPVETPPVETPPVETPGVEVPGVEVDLPVDAGGLAGG
jgi:RNA polymerase sigma factor (sigma-70 family)